MKSDSILGTRPGTALATPKIYSTQSLMMRDDEAGDLMKLYKTVWDKGANCTDDPDKWTGDDLPTDREAQANCSGCPALKLCREYARKNQPAHGVWGGEVYGREENDD